MTAINVQVTFAHFAHAQIRRSKAFFRRLVLLKTKYQIQTNFPKLAGSLSVRQTGLLTETCCSRHDKPSPRINPLPVMVIT